MIKLYIGQAIIDISNYIDEGSIAYRDTIDETKAHGGFTIPFVKMSAIAGLDMSIPLPQLTKIELTVDGEITYWKLSEDKVSKVRKGANPLYRHDITMIEPTIDLTLRALPDMTITQPKGVIDDYVYTINQLNGKTTITEDIGGLDVISNKTQGVKVDNTLTSLGFNYGVSNNISIIDDMTLKTVRDYEIVLNYDLYGVQYQYTESATPEADIKFIVYSNGVEIDNFTVSMKQGRTEFNFFGSKIYPYEVRDKYVLNYTSTTTNEVITVKAQTLDYYNATTLEEDKVWIMDLAVNVMTYEENVDNPKTMLDEAVDKILLIHNQAPKQLPSQEFTLATQTRNRIKNIEAPEMTFSSYTVFEALQELASYVNAIVYIGENDWSTIYFMFYDDIKIESGITYIDETKQTVLNDYATGYEINAKNVVKENNKKYAHVDPSDTGWLSVRTTDIGEINDTNSIFATTLPLYYETEFIVKGLAFTMKDELNADVNFADTVEWDITDYLVEKTKWNSLENTSNANTRDGTLNKGNTLYYIKGQKNIFNIGYNDVILAPAWNTALAANYAIVEAILSKAAEENPTYTFTSGYKPSASVFNLRARVRYMAFSNARITVYKDNASSLNEAIRYFNEQSNVNDMNKLGDYAQKSINRRGNPNSTYKGITTNIRNLVHLGMKNAYNERLTAYAVSITPTIRTIILEYSKFNPNISNYVNVNSEHRQYEVPTNDLVIRKDKYKEFVYLSETNETPTFTIYEITQLLANFKTTPDGSKLTYAMVELDYDGNGYTKKVEATVDVLAAGTTTAIQIELQDNYSAGGKIIEGQVVDEIQKRLGDVRYTDTFGQFKNVKVSLYETHAITDSDEYPDNQDTVANPESQLELVVLKDAREIWGLTQELNFRTNYPNIEVFSGIAKFNGLVAKGSDVQTQPFLLKEGYFPQSEDIDTTQLVQCDWVSYITGNELETQFNSIPIGDYEGYIWMETSTMTPMFAVQTEAYNTSSVTNLAHIVYMYTSYGSTAAFYVVNLSSSYTLNDTIDIELSTDYEIDLTDTLTLTTTSTDTNFVFPIVSIGSTLSITDTLDIEKSTDYELDLTDTITLSTVHSEEAFLYVDTSQTVTLELTDTLDIEISTDYDLDLADTITITATSTDTTFIFPITSMSATSFTLSDTLTLEQSTDYEFDVSDTMSLNTTMNEIKMTCTWELDGSQYTAIRDRSRNTSGSCMIVDATKTECVLIAGTWYCQDYIANIIID